MNTPETQSPPDSKAGTRACCWPGCTTMVPRSMWGCKRHWLMLPKPIRGRIWAAYESGQEHTGKISQAYGRAFREALVWIHKNYPGGEAVLPGFAEKEGDRP